MSRSVSSPARRAAGSATFCPWTSRTRSSPSRAGHRRPDEVGLAEEVRDEGRGRRLVELGRAAQLLDPPGVHHRDGVGHRHGLFLVVRDVHEGEADLGLDPLELDLHLPAQLEVERAERLVEQQHRRAVDDRPGQRDALLLAAGELGRLAPGHLAELDQLERRLDLRLHLLAAATAQAERDVLEDVEVREQRVALEDGVDRPLVRLGVGDVVVADAGSSRRSAPRGRPPSAAWSSCRSRTDRAARRTSRTGSSATGRRRPRTTRSAW